MSKQTINPGNPPIVWSTIDDAFEKINSNFTELYLSIGGPGVDLSAISSSIIPDVDIGRDLGSPTRRWRDLYLGPDSLYLGTAQISANPDGTVNLPAGSKVGGALIRNPSESNFRTVRVAGQNDVVANDFQGVLNLSGSFIAISTDATTDTVLFANTGVTTLSGSAAISVSSASGNVTITNTGVTSLTAGTGIGVSTSTGNITITNAGVTQLTTDPGSGISISATSGVINISNSAPNVNQDVFKFIDLGPDRLEPTGPTTVLNLNEGSGIDITINNSTKTLSIANTGVLSIAVGSGLIASSGSGNVTLSISSPIINSFVGDLKGSVFGDDSSILVDAVSNYIYGNVSATTLRTTESIIKLGQRGNDIPQDPYAISIGHNAGDGGQGVASIAIGYTTAALNQGDAAVAIGSDTASMNQGNYAVAIGLLAGGANQGVASIAIGRGAGNGGCFASSIILNATGGNITSAASGFYVAPIRSTSNGRPLMYDTSTYEIFSSNVLEFVGSTISTSDSSNIVVDVLTVFNSDINVENEILLQGSRVINLAELKTVVAASIDFADFQARIAALV